MFDVFAFFSVGPLEIAVLAVIALLILGPQKLPEAARSVGRGMREMREALSGVGDDHDDDYEEDDEHTDAEDEEVAPDEDETEVLEDEPARTT